MDTVAFLLDAPHVGGDTTSSQHPIARLGNYTDPRYGRFSITRQQFTSWRRNLAEIQGGRISIDYDHQAEMPAGSTKAAGWITRLTLTTGKALQEQDPAKYKALDATAEYALADIDWTPEGAQSVRDRYWLFVSPTFQDSYDDEQGKDRGPTLVGVALTNRPFLRQGMPAISLSRALASHGHGGELPAAVLDDTTSDSRDDMTDFIQKLRTALGLADDADETKILTAVTETHEKTKLSLDARATADGKVILTTAAHDELKAKAGETDNAKLELTKVSDRLTAVEMERQDEKFTLAYDAALNDPKGGRVASDEETRKEWKQLYDAAPDIALKRLAALPVIAKRLATGGGDDGGETPEGMDPERHALAVRARKIMTDQKLTDYSEALSLARQEA